MSFGPFSLDLPKGVRCCAVNRADGKRCAAHASNSGYPSVCGGHRSTMKRRAVTMDDGSVWEWTHFRMHVESLRGGGSG